MKKKSMLSTIYKNNIILLAIYIIFSVLAGVVLSVSTNVRTEFIDSLVNNDSRNIPVSLIKNVCTIFLYSYLLLGYNTIHVLSDINLVVRCI